MINPAQVHQPLTPELLHRTAARLCNRLGKTVNDLQIFPHEGCVWGGRRLAELLTAPLPGDGSTLVYGAPDDE
jgi:hypothetical protein